MAHIYELQLIQIMVKNLKLSKSNHQKLLKDIASLFSL